MKILLVDDDEVVREVVALMLDAEGHQVVPAGSGAEALERLVDGLTVDVVLTDLSMPGLRGWDVASAVRARWPRVRIGLITGTPEQMPSRGGVIDVVISKPVTMTALRSALESLARGGTGPTA